MYDDTCTFEGSSNGCTLKSNIPFKNSSCTFKNSNQWLSQSKESEL